MRRTFRAVDRLQDATAVASMNILSIASTVLNGETITIGKRIYEITVPGRKVTPGNSPIDIGAAASIKAASLAGGFTGNAAVNETVTVAGQQYRFQATVGLVADQVLIGADAPATMANLIAAINGTPPSGQRVYGFNTQANQSVTAAAVDANNFQVTARVKGSGGNGITVNEATANFAWAGAATTLAGGSDATAADALPLIVAGLNKAHSGLFASNPVPGEIFLTADNGDWTPYACSENLSGAGNSFASPTAWGGRQKSPELPVTTVVERVVMAKEVGLGFVRIQLGFSPTYATAKVVTSAGVAKPWDGAVAFTGNVVTVNNSGTSDFAAGDKVVLTASR